MVRMDSFSSVPPHIQPPMAQVPSAIRELTIFVPPMSMYSSMLSFLLVFSEIVVFLAEPLGVGVGAIEVVARFVKLELAGLGSFCSFCEQCSNLGRVECSKTASRLKSLLKNRERVAAGDDNASGKIHRIVKAFHGGRCFAFENKVVTHGLHTEHPDIVLKQDRQHFLFKAVEVR